MNSVDEELSYCIKRAVQEGAAAEAATLPEAIAAHLQLAHIYDARAQALRESKTPR